MKDEGSREKKIGFHPSSLILRFRRALRGEVSPRTAALEMIRRVRLSLARRRERAQLSQLNQEPAKLTADFVGMSVPELLAHFRSRRSPQFFPGFEDAGHSTAQLQLTLFPDDTDGLIKQAKRIAHEHCWPLLGFREKCFGAGEINWNLDPLSGFDWPLAYHADINLIRNDGSDARVVWELNRLAHLITLGRAYAVTNGALARRRSPQSGSPAGVGRSGKAQSDSTEKFSTEFFRQLASWRAQNPVGRGVNWNCAMEVALRAMNLLAGFTLFLHAPQMNEEALTGLLMMFEQHGAHIQRNLEFSHLANSNHYLSDVTGLLWLGIMLPELEAAREWREFGLRELLGEMDKQILRDGADYEASTGYHRFKLELFLYSFVLCHLNEIYIGDQYWSKLRGMIEYVRAYLRPDGHAPLIGDSDSGQVLPTVRRTGDDHAYVLAIGAAVFKEPRFKLKNLPLPEELLWILGAQGVRDYQTLAAAEPSGSQAFPDSGTYILRDDDLYLLLNASGSGVNGRGSHGHNDALSIEVAACGVPFIVDAGTYVYTADLHERNLFRSTAYHSTVEVDGIEQNTTNEAVPFVIGDEAHPRVLSYELGREYDTVAAEHYGYTHLPGPVIHCRKVVFDKRARCWRVTDLLHGRGEHIFRFNFVFAAEIETILRPDGTVQARYETKPGRLFLTLLDRDQRPEFVPRSVSCDYGAREATVAARWSINARAPLIVRWALVPVCHDDDEAHRLELIENLRRQAARGEIRFGVLSAPATT